MKKIKSKITGVGSYLPSKIVTNYDLSKTLDTDDLWIRERTGIRQRHIADETEDTSDLGTHAAKNALKDSNTDPFSIDMIIVATTTSDKVFPSVAAKIQSKLQASNAFAFDIQAVCSGFVYALSVADNYIKLGQAKKILVIGAEKLSKIIDWNDRRTAILFGDGAGAVVLEANQSSEDPSDILYSKLYTDGSLYNILQTSNGAHMSPKSIKIEMEGKEVFKHAVSKMFDAVSKALNQLDITTNDIDFIIPHQANNRIISALQKKLGLDKNKVISSVETHANTSAASIPLALKEKLYLKL